jgi:hypothetical protein
MDISAHRGVRRHRSALYRRCESGRLIVHDLKRGADARGTVGLFVDNGTDGHFRNLSIRLQ